MSLFQKSGCYRIAKKHLPVFTKTKKGKTITDQVTVARVKAAGRGRGSRRKMLGLKFSAKPNKKIRNLMPRHLKNRLHPENEIGFATLALQRAKSEPQSPFHADAQSDYEAW